MLTIPDRLSNKHLTWQVSDFGAPAPKSPTDEADQRRRAPDTVATVDRCRFTHEFHP